MRRRNRHVSVWMNEQEYQHLKAQAKKAGLGIDPFIRNLVAGIQLRPRPPDEVAALALYLASDISSHIMGSGIRIDGGLDATC